MNVETKSPATGGIYFLAMKRIPLEAVMWITALASLAIYYPGSSHVTLCPFANLGIDFCPGCGLGRSISYALHGEFICSWQTHPLGPCAVIVLTLRTIDIIKNKTKLAWQR
jgi:hypothetical protein